MRETKEKEGGVGWVGLKWSWKKKGCKSHERKRKRKKKRERGRTGTIKGQINDKRQKFTFISRFKRHVVEDHKGPLLCSHGEGIRTLYL
jgi:hypothetical protein